MKKLLLLFFMWSVAMGAAWAQGNIVAAISIDQARCSNSAVLTASVISGGEQPFSFTWTTGDTSPNITVGPGTYSVVIRDNAGTERTVSATVRSYIIPEIITNNSNFTCNNRSVTLTVGGTLGSPFVWTDTQTSTNPRPIVAPAPGTTSTYTVQVSTGDMCSTSVTVANNITDEVENINSTLCPGETFCFDGPGGSDCLTSGSATRTYTKADGCTRTVNVVITNVQYEILLSEVRICDGNSYTLPNSTPPAIYNAPGVYDYEAGTGANGCKRFIRTILRVTTKQTLSPTVYICTGDVYQIGLNPPRTTTGNYVDTIQSRLFPHCDSIEVRTNLIVNNPVNFTKTILSCEPVRVNGVLYSSSTSFTVNYADPTIGNCQNDTTYNITVSQNLSRNQIVGICPGGSYSIGGSTYVQAGQYTNVTPFAAGGANCTITVNTDLRVITPVLRSEAPVICKGDIYIIGTGTNIDTFKTSGTYTHIDKSYGYQGGTGCDSVVTTVNLTINSLNVIDRTSYGVCNNRTAGNIVLSAQGGVSPYTYAWSVNAVNNNAEYRYCLPAGEYTVTVTESSALACKWIKTFTIFTDDPANCLRNNEAFTPNGDVYNETWQIPCVENESNYVRVYNRWGQVLFEQRDYRGDWGGTSDGKPLPDGTYYYVIQSKASTYRGTVTIMRQ
jgi:gliding motility-associated-like protein